MSNISELLTPLVIFEDPHLIVLSKPAGLLSQGEITGEVNLVDWLRERLGRPYVGLIHRLDRNTSGIMIVAKRTKAASRLSESLKKDELKRTYLALVEGEIKTPTRLTHFLLKNPKTNKTEASKTKKPGSKASTLQLIPLRTIHIEGHTATWIRIQLETGRSHQIRAQLAAERRPLIGDTKYGGTRAGRIHRPALHSHTLEFIHPMSREKMTFEAPLPQDLAQLYY